MVRFGATQTRNRTRRQMRRQLQLRPNCAPQSTVAICVVELKRQCERAISTLRCTNNQERDRARERPRCALRGGGQGLAGRQQQQTGTHHTAHLRNAPPQMTPNLRWNFSLVTRVQRNKKAEREQPLGLAEINLCWRAHVFDAGQKSGRDTLSSWEQPDSRKRHHKTW